MIIKLTYTDVDCITKIEQTIVKSIVVISDLGAPGANAYQIALSNDPNIGTEEEWLESLKAKNYIRRHDFVSNVSYCGYAEEGALESADVWNISKITVATEGTTTIAHATDVNWTGHITHIYT